MFFRSEIVFAVFLWSQPVPAIDPKIDKTRDA